MAQGDFTKQEAEEVEHAVGELFEGIPKSRRGGYIGYLNDIYLFLSAAKAAAPNATQAGGENAASPNP